MKNSSSYFENRDCKFYPCHRGIENMNCMFCYCPLYCKKNCPGNPVYIEVDNRTIKDCSECVYPHKAENYKNIIRILGES